MTGSVTPSLPEFAGADRVDVDRDGRDDLVLRMPALQVTGERQATFREMPPAVVAHRLADGRYALDDEVARASLRALCPAPPPAPRPPPRRRAEAGDELIAYTEILFLDGFCARVWGASLDAAVAGLRETVRIAPPGLYTEIGRDAAIAALRTFPVPLRLERLEVAPLALAPIVESPALPSAPAPDPRCAPAQRAVASWLDGTNQALDERSAPESRSHVGFRDDRLCLADARGVWSIALGAVRFERGVGDAVVTTGTLSWRPASGAAGPSPVRFEIRLHENESRTVALVGSTDYDGDGAPEVLVRRVDTTSGGGPPLTHEVYSVRDGAIRAYEPARAFANIRGVADADGDGRPDLVLPSPWSVNGWGGTMGDLHEGPPALAHSLPDGTFSTSDGVVQTWMLSNCSRDESEFHGYPTLLDVGCARARGDAPEAVVAGLQRRSPASHPRDTEEIHEGLCLPFHALASQALIPPPFRVAR